MFDLGEHVNRSLIGRHVGNDASDLIVVVERACEFKDWVEREAYISVDVDGVADVCHEVIHFVTSDLCERIAVTDVDWLSVDGDIFPRLGAIECGFEVVVKNSVRDAAQPIARKAVEYGSACAQCDLCLGHQCHY